MLKIKKSSRLVFIVMFINLFACSQQDSDKEIVKHSQISDDSVSLNNKGVGEMGAFDYEKATITFEKLVAMNPEWDLANQNLAIALLNRQKPGDEEKSVQIAESLIAKNESNLVAHYIVAILKFNQGLCDDALIHFNRIINSPDADAYTLYFAGQCYIQNGDAEKALNYYQQSLKKDSYLRSAYYGAFMASQRLGEMKQAQEMLEFYKRMESNPKANLAEIKYTRMGPKADARAYSENEIKHEFKTPSAPYFSEIETINLNPNMKIDGAGVVNLVHDEKIQLYVFSGEELYILDNFRNKPVIIEKFTTNVGSGKHNIAWGDINNDNRIDFYLTGENDQLYLQSDSGFEKADMQQSGFGTVSSKAVRLADADHDGDLDVLVLSQSGRFEIWNNNLDTTFTALSNKTRLIDEEGYLGIYIQDIDRDRDADIVLLAENKLTTLLNDRMWDYELLDSRQFDRSIHSLVFSDNNINGIPDINLQTSKEIMTLEFDTKTRDYQYTSRVQFATNGETMHMADVNGDGLSEFLIQNDNQISVMDIQERKLESLNVDKNSQFKVVNTIQGPEILIIGDDSLAYFSASENRNSYILFDVSGKEDEANSVRSNFSGIGATYTIRNRNFFSLGDSFQNQSGTGQDYQPQLIASGSQPVIDYLSLEWSDGVYQSEVGLKSNQYYKITETQRQLSSCPVIFVKNNGKYQFISDVLGVGGIGFALGRHEYGVPRPWENYLLTDKQISPENGLFKLQFTEPMEESAYLDSIHIEVIDVPDSYYVTLDERMSVSQPYASGRPLYYNELIHPQNVINNYGKDVTAEVRSTDKKAADIVNADTRFLGLVDEQQLTMNFSGSLQGKYHLIMNGWVEYGYSQTMFAAWQAGKSAHAPSIEYFYNGEWITLLKEFGYPAGMPRMASVPLNLPVPTQKLRITTNMEIYFDELSLFKSIDAENVIKQDLKLKSAELSQLGFPERSNNSQRVPSYDYTNINPFWDTRYMSGAYTRLGDITELLESQDNALAIIGAGESIELTFSDDLDPIYPGYNRYYILKFKGWAKDMDILTQNGDTLKPIPFDGKITERAKNLNRKYNTRFKAGK